MYWSLNRSKLQILNQSTVRLDAIRGNRTNLSQKSNTNIPENDIIRSTLSWWPFIALIAPKKGENSLLFPIQAIERKNYTRSILYSKYGDNSRRVEGLHIIWHLNWLLADDFYENRKSETTLTRKIVTFRFEVLSVGLMNAPAQFKRIINEILKELPFLQCYIDDLIIYSKNCISTYWMSRQWWIGYKQTMSKLFAKKSIQQLGHNVNQDEIKVDPEKTK